HARATAESNAQQAELNAQVAAANEREASSLALAANARNALVENNSVLALALALEADEVVDPAPVEVLRILASAAYGPGVQLRMEGHEASVLSANFSEDG